MFLDRNVVIFTEYIIALDVHSTENFDKDLEVEHKKPLEP
jgi:hypothetical protein